MRLLILLLFCVMLSAQSIQLSDNTSLNYKGNLDYHFWYFPNEAPIAGQPETVNTIKGQLDLRFLFAAPVEIKINPRFTYDPDNSDRNRFAINDLYLDYFSTSFELRAGYSIYNWETVESVSQADFINQRDYEGNLLDPERFGELNLRFRFIPDTETEQVWSLYYFPYFQPTYLPVGVGNRYSFQTPFPISNDHDLSVYQSTDKQWRPQFAVTYRSALIESIDFNFFYFNGYNRFPGLVPDALPVPTKLVHEYRLVHKAGMTFQGETGSWLLKGELVQTTYQKDVLNQNLKLVKPSYFAYTTGFEYTFYSLLVDNHDLGTIVELIGDTDTGIDPAELEGFRPFQNHLFFGLRYTFNNISDRSFLLGGFYDYKEGDTIIQFEYNERLFENLTIKIQYSQLDLTAGQLSTFTNNDRLTAEFGFNF